MEETGTRQGMWGHGALSSPCFTKTHTPYQQAAPPHSLSHNPCTSALMMHVGVSEGHHLPHEKAGFCLHISKYRLVVPV